MTDIKAEIRERKRLRKLGMLPGPPHPGPTVNDQDPSPQPGPTVNDPEPSPPPVGRLWTCRVCRTGIRSTQIPAGWLSIARWPPDRERFGPITSTFCRAACAMDYLQRVELGGAVQFPVKGGKQAKRQRYEERKAAT